MNSQLYDTIVRHIAELNYPLTIDPLQRLHPHVHSLTLGSILSQERQRRLSARSAVSRADISARKQPTALDRYIEAVGSVGEEWSGAAEGLLIRQAVESNISPAALARLVLVQYLDCMDAEFRRMGETSSRVSGSSGGDKNGVASPPNTASSAAAATVCGSTARRQLVNNLLRNTHRLHERFAALEWSSTATTASAKSVQFLDRWRLADELRRCVCIDPCCGVSAETIKQTIGVEYELRLVRALRRCSVAFVDEAELRRRGYDKTPDILLEIPVAVEGCVVNWIDSKASFGDRQSHAEYMRSQYVQYWRRYGPGLVIYWFGFLAELIGPSSEQHVLLKDHFPEESLVFMRPELAVRQCGGVLACSRSSVNTGRKGGASEGAGTDSTAASAGEVNLTPSGEHNTTPCGEVTTAHSAEVNTTPIGQLKTTPSGEVNITPSGELGGCGELSVRRSLVKDMLQLSEMEDSKDSQNLSKSRDLSDSNLRPG